MAPGEEGFPMVARVVVGAVRAERLGAVEEGGGDKTEVDDIPESAAERGELGNHGLLPVEDLFA